MLTGAVLVFLVAPILTIVPLSFSSGSFFYYPLPGFSLRWYQDFFTSSFWLPSLKNSLIIGISATVLATVLGTMAALGIWRARFPAQALVLALLISPMVVPVIIVAVGVYFAFAPLGLTDGYLGLILAHTTLGVPFVVITVLATLSGVRSHAAARRGKPGRLADHDVSPRHAAADPARAWPRARCSRSRRRSTKSSSSC